MGKVYSTLTLRLIVIFLICVCHFNTISFSGYSSSTSRPITIMELHILSNIIRKLLKLSLPFLVIHIFMYNRRVMDIYIFIVFWRIDYSKLNSDILFTSFHVYVSSRFKFQSHMNFSVCIQTHTCVIQSSL